MPTPVPENLRYGGNTTCLEIRVADGRILVIDAGTGIRSLGLEIGPPRLFRCHCCSPISTGITSRAFPSLHRSTTPATASTSIRPAPSRRRAKSWKGRCPRRCFPVPFEYLAAVRQFHQVLEPFELGPIRVTPVPLHHPQGASGYRLDCAGHSIVHACDHEPGVQEIDDRIVRVAEGADVLICDAQYTPAEYECRRGWGHGTWLDSVRMAKRAGVKKLVLTHHDPDHDDAYLDGLLVCARQEFAATVAAAEGLVLSFP